MKQSVRNILALLLIGGMAIGFAFGGAWLLYMQSAGTPTSALVANCERRQRAEVCYGSWEANGATVVGELENVSSDQLGQRIEVRALGERAIQPGLRLPLTLFGVAVVVALLGWRWWKTEAVR